MFFAGAEVGKELPDVIISWRPVAVILFPLAASLLLLLAARKLKRFVGVMAASAGGVTFLLVLTLYPLIRQGIVEYHYSSLMSIGLLFRADYLGFIFAFLISLCWMLVLLYAVFYMEVEEHKVFYFSFSLLTLASCLGVVLTGDLVSLFLFFELLTFSSYLLVINRMNKEALSAGLFTLYMGLAGGLVLLFGIFYLYSVAGTVELAPLMEKLAELPSANLAVIFLCFLVGFGIKAGIVPLHFWMPKAYAASPAVVNALSSGAMIKAGIYGLLRIIMLVLTPASVEARELFSFASSAGYAVIWLGLLTMVAGAVMALLQGNILRLLAYSSISQMGYVLTGLGAGAYLFGAEEAMGFSGAVLHSFNHTLFKTAFFLIAGIIFFRTKEVELKKLGGLGREMPFTAILFVAFILAIAGIPGFNGYISKTLIHDALLEAHHHFHTWHILLAEKIFMLGSALTLCYYLKFFQGAFLGAKPPHLRLEKKAPLLLYGPLLALFLFVLAVGFYPNFFLEEFVIAAAEAFTFDHHSLEHLVGFHFFDPHPLESALKVLFLALAIYLPLNKWKILEKEPPRYLSLESLIFTPIANFVYRSICRLGVMTDGSVNRFYLDMSRSLKDFCRYVHTFDSGLDNFYMASSKSAQHLIEKSKQFDDALMEGYEKTSYKARDWADRTARLDGALNKAYEVTGEAARRMAEGTLHLDEALNKTYERTGDAARRLADGSEKLDGALDKSYENVGASAKQLLQKGATTRKEADESTEEERAPVPAQKRSSFNPLEWNIRNINFDSLLLAMMLGLVIVILFYFTRRLIGL